MEKEITDEDIEKLAAAGMMAAKAALSMVAFAKALGELVIAHGKFAASFVEPDPPCKPTP